jgi:hypothetical protein
MLGDHRLHAVGGKHFEGAGESGLRLRVSIHPEKERAVGAGLAAVSADGLGDGDDNPEAQHGPSGVDLRQTRIGRRGGRRHGVVSLT